MHADWLERKRATRLEALGPIAQERQFELRKVNRRRHPFGELRRGSQAIPRVFGRERDRDVRFGKTSQTANLRAHPVTRGERDPMRLKVFDLLRTRSRDAEPDFEHRSERGGRAGRLAVDDEDVDLREQVHGPWV
jgi:hypothetical protein